MRCESFLYFSRVSPCLGLLSRPAEHRLWLCTMFLVNMTLPENARALWTCDKVPAAPRRGWGFLDEPLNVQPCGSHFLFVLRNVGQMTCAPLKSSIKTWQPCPHLCLLNVGVGFEMIQDFPALFSSTLIGISEMLPDLHTSFPGHRKLFGVLHCYRTGYFGGWQGISTYFALVFTFISNTGCSSLGVIRLGSVPDLRREASRPAEQFYGASDFMGPPTARPTFGCCRTRLCEAGKGRGS